MNSLKIRIISICSFLFIYSGIFLVLENTKEKRIQYALDKEISNLQLHYDIMLHQFKIDTSNAYSKIKNKQNILDILKEAIDASDTQRELLRAKLINIMSKHYGRLQKRGVLQLQFVFPNNISFLRMHKPSKYGDNLSDIRYSFSHTNKTQEISVGFEQGRTSHGFRYVAPLYDKKQYIGALEISFGSEIIQHNLMNTSKIYSHFIVNKKVFDVKAWDREDLNFNYISSIENPNYLFSKLDDIDHEKLYSMKQKLGKEFLSRIEQKINNGGTFALCKEIDSYIQVLTFIPIKNVKKTKTVAYIVAYTKNKHIENILNNFVFFYISSFILLAMIFVFIYNSIASKDKLKQEVREQLKQLRDKDLMIIKQSRFASMGEMIGNIAHQWRQPLNSVGATMMKLEILNELEYNDSEKIVNIVNTTNKSLEYMSKTIDDFREFFTSNNIKQDFLVKDSISSASDIIGPLFTNHNIDLKINIDNDNLKLYGNSNELTQVLLNILNNAKDAFVLREVCSTDKCIVELIVKEKKIIIKDNAGGIPSDIIDKVFEPYFTTKFKSQGTGIGLYMSKMIIEKGFDSNIFVSNNDDGAVFTIEFL